MAAQSKVVARLQQVVYVLGALSWVTFVIELFLHDYIGGGGATVILMSLGPLAMGFFVASWSWISGGRLGDAFGWVTLCVSLVLLIAWPIATVMEEFGGAATNLIIIFLMTAALGGVLYGWVTWNLRQPCEIVDVSGTLTHVSKAVDNDSCVPASVPKQVKLPNLFWLVLGLLLSCGLTVLAAWISYDFVDRGPVTMRTTWGGEIHAYDKAVNIATGLLIAVIGWVAGLIGLRYHLPRPLTIGIILGASLLGIGFAVP